MRRFALLILLAAAGCSDAFLRDADRQVYRIENQRKQQTLGYTPASKVVTPATSPSPKRPSYAKLPTTPVPPPTTSPLEQQPRGLQFDRLGPPADPGPMVSADDDSAAAATAGGSPLDRAVRDSRRRLVLGPPVWLLADLRLDLFQSIHYAVNHARTYQSRLEDLYLRTLDVTLQRHLFEPIPFAQSSLRYNGGGEDTNHLSALRAVQSLGVREQLPYGGFVQAAALVTFVDALNDNSVGGEDASLALTASIPLLRGAGLVNLEPLINSERQLVYQVRAFEDYRRAFVVDISTTYFRLLTQQGRIANRRLRYISSAALTERTEALYAAGLLNYLEVQRTRGQQLQAEDDLNVAVENYASSVDDFKVQLGMPVTQPVDVTGIELAVDVPQVDETQIERRALQYRLDLQTARDRIDDTRRGVANAQNGLLPDLSLDLNGELGNTPGTAARAINGQTVNYSAQATFDWPLDRLRERNQLRAAFIDFARAQRTYIDARENALGDVRAGLRNIRSALSTLNIQRVAIELAQRRLDYANELLIQGQSNARDVVEAQQLLLSAQDSFDSAKANLQIAVLTYLRDTGTLRVSPDAGSIGQAMDRDVADAEPTFDERRIADRAAAARNNAMDPTSPGSPATIAPLR